MGNKIKNYLEYKKNIKIVKTEFAQIAATALPALRKSAENKTGILKFIQKLTDSTRNMDGKELTSMVLKETAGLLSTSQERLVEILTYIAGLEPDEIQKILVHSIIETLPEENK